MAVRNFWIDAEIDGRKTPISGGPRAKDGEMVVTIYQRDEGSIKRAVKISCWSGGDQLATIVSIDGKRVGTFWTKR